MDVKIYKLLRLQLTALPKANSITSSFLGGRN